MDRLSNSSPIAIVGMACRLPGANTLDDFWRLIRDGISTEQQLPPDRFDYELYYDPKRGVRNRSYSRIGCLVDYDYHSSAFDLLPDSVRNCPEIAYRTLCEVAAEAFVNADIPWHNRTTNGGVFIGHTRNSGLAGDLSYGTYIRQIAPILRRSKHFQDLGRVGDEIIDQIVDEVRQEMPHRDPHGGPAIGAAIAAGMLNQTFGLNGPYMAFNSACASSLHALAQGVRALQSGRIDLALVGGASFAHHDTFVMFSQAHSLSAEGSRPFDAKADGLVVGEGYATVILKRLDEAIVDGNRIHAVIRSIGISSDGKGKSLWAPRHEGQIEAIRRAYQSISPESVQYIEAHATSTQVGDATELRALHEAMSLSKGKRIPIGSVKANIGHTLETAGISGLLKSILCIEHQEIPSATNLETLNPSIPWDEIPFHVPRQSSPWQRPEDSPRRAAVNAFGIGGLNAHIVIDEYAAESPKSFRQLQPSRDQSAASSSDEAIAVVGRGSVVAGALSVSELMDLIQSGKDPKQPVTAKHLNVDDYLTPGQIGVHRVHTTLAGEVVGHEYDWRKHRIPPKQISSASPLQFMILDAVEEAFADAGLEPKEIDRRKIGVMVGNTFGGEFSNKLLMGLRIPDFQRRLRNHLNQLGVQESVAENISQEYADELLKEMPALLDETGSFTSSSLASRITKSFDLMGGGVAVDSDATSSSSALMCCADQLLAGDCDMMVCVGAQEDLSITRFEGMGMAGMLSQGSAVSPFDEACDGGLPGEGCGVLLLMRLSDAQAKGMPIHGIIQGIGVATAPNLRDASALASRRALKATSLSRAPVTSADVARIETTTLGVPTSTHEELAGIAEVYSSSHRPYPLLLDCISSQVGHTGSAVGAVSTVKATIELNSLKLSQTFKLQQPSTDVITHRFAVLQQPQEFHPANPQGRLVTAVHNTGYADSAYHILIERGSTVAYRFQPTQDLAPSNMESETQNFDGIPHFDATMVRKNKMRQKAQASATPSELRNGHHPPTSSNGFSPDHSRISDEPLAEVAAPNQGVSTPVPASSDATKAPEWTPQQLEEFLINFVVEQTGYPPEIVEMDADLEADLGIDSIKKAQLFGEIGQQFQVEPDPNLTLDDFPTLKHVANYLLTGSGDTQSTKVAEVTASRAVEKLPTAATESISHTSSSMTAEELTEFLVNFVVEQTGYPPEIVEMDADLEADLGIDSIKKAQLFGEIGQHFSIEPDPNLTLDDFPSLQTVANFILRNDRPADQPTPVAPVTTPTNPATASYSNGAVTNGSPNNGHAHSWSRRELDEFLVNFVVEQTGYPPEIVEMDADLEADLGIDSIKKAQLFGEIGEHFDVEPDTSLTLDDFPTLSHVSEFIAKQVVTS